MALHKTYIWQIEPRQPRYRIQTDDPAIARKLRRRRSCRLTTEGLNQNLWIFETDLEAPAAARELLEKLTGKKVRRDSRGVLVSCTHPLLDLQQLSLALSTDD
ncbi:MAG: hypothetical protein ABIA75_07005 [Candidatus Neomarinimicrobiota bacterium]